MKSLTVITVCYNSEATIERCIESIGSQLNDSVEYIIIDGLSKDNTLKIIKKKAEVYPIKFYSEPDSGIYYAMNKGASKAEGEWIWFVNSDDYIKQGVIVQILETILINQKNYDCIYGDLEHVRIYNGQDYTKKRIPAISKNLFINDTLFHPSFLCKKKVFDKEKGFNEEFKVVSDWDFMIRLYIKHYNFLYIPQIFTVFYSGGVSSNSNIFEKYRVRKKYNHLYIAVYFLFIDIGKEFAVYILKKLRKYKERKYKYGIRMD